MRYPKKTGSGHIHCNVCHCLFYQNNRHVVFFLLVFNSFWSAGHLLLNSHRLTNSEKKNKTHFNQVSRLWYNSVPLKEQITKKLMLKVWLGLVSKIVARCWYCSLGWVKMDYCQAQLRTLFKSMGTSCGQVRVKGQQDWSHCTDRIHFA